MSNKLYYKDGSYLETDLDWELKSKLEKIHRIINNTPIYFNGKCCIVCSKAIPEQRLQLKTYRCISCQVEYENNV